MKKLALIVLAAASLVERRAWHRRSTAAAITVTGTTATDIASDTTMTIDIITGETPAAQGL